MLKECIFFEDWKPFSVGTAATNYDFLRVDPGYILRVDRVAIKNTHSSQTILALVGPMVGGSLRTASGAAALAAYDIFEDNGPFWVLEGNFPRVNLKASGSATTGEIFIQGWLCKIE